MSKKRERLEVIYDILKAIRDNKNSIRPTRLLYSSNLSPQMFKEYRNELERKGFFTVNKDKGITTISLTQKGFEFLDKYRIVIEFVEGFGL